MEESQWRAAVNGADARPWFVCRGHGSQTEVASDARGYYRRFATCQGASRAADNLNASRVTREQQELDAGLGQWVRDLIAARRAGNRDLARNIRAAIKKQCKALSLDEHAVFFAYGDPDAPT